MMKLESPSLPFIPNKSISSFLDSFQETKELYAYIVLVLFIYKNNHQTNKQK